MEIRDLDMEIPREPRRRIRKQSGIDPQKKSLILGAAGALVLFVLLLLFFGSGGDENGANELNVIKSRLDGLEKRLARIEGGEPKISSSEARIRGFLASVNRLEGLTRSVKDRMDRLEQAYGPSAPRAPSASPASAERRLHEVQPGESLFSIAKKYGMSVKGLRRLNRLSKSVIQPGQKLIVEAGA